MTGETQNGATPEGPPAELDPEFEARMEELVGENTETEPDEPELDESDYSNEALLNKSRKIVMEKLESLSARDVMMVFIKAASLEEARLKESARRKQDDKGREDLVAKARRAMERR
jgi:hypothetical protein